MPPLKRNHYVPKFMISYWATVHPKRGYKGVWVYDLEAKQKYFANGQGQNAYAFAAADDLYIPVVEGERATAQERWFSGMEAILASFAKQVDAKADRIDLKSEADVSRLLMALFSLECRSPYNIEQMVQAIEKDPKLLDWLATRPGVPVRHLVLENLINYTTEHALRSSPPELTVLHSDGSPLLLCDRPYFTDASIPARIMALTSRVCVAVQRGQRRPMVYRYMDAAEEFIRIVNHQFALQARRWIAASSEAVLDRYTPVVQSAEWEASRAADRVAVDPVEALRMGWKIGRDRPKRQ